jgi:hypothetical protein
MLANMTGRLKVVEDEVEVPLTLANVIGRLKVAEDEVEAPLTSVNHTNKMFTYRKRHGKRSGSCGKDPTMADQAAEVAAMVPIVVGVVAAEIATTTVIPAVHLHLDQARWVVTSAAKRGTGRDC